MKKFACLIATTAVISAGCQKKETPAAKAPEPAAATGETAVQAKPELPIATHLGFATRVPANADFFISGHDAGKTLLSLFDPVFFVKDGEGDKEKLSEMIEKSKEVAEVVGDEAFVFVGPGVGSQLETVGLSYRGISAAWAEFAVGLALDTAAKKEGDPDLSALENSLSSNLSERWMEALEKDSRLQVPTVVMGWRPAAAKLEECRAKLEEGLGVLIAEGGKATPVSFESSGTTMKGYELSGRDAFGEMVTEIRENLQKEEAAAEVMEQFSPERIERLLVALENVRFTVASGVLDGRVLIYLGNGKEGLHLAAKPEESLAATDALKWTHDFAEKRLIGVSYFSEPMVRAVLPWLDGSEFWRALSRSIRPPVQDERMMRELLAGMADIDRDLAKREASPWSAMILEDQGWRYESRGGWPDPGLDYATPLRMTGAAASLQPVVRLHWVQSRQRKDRQWEQTEQFGMLLEAVLGEVRKSGTPMAEMLPEEITTRLVEEVRKLNHTYRDEFRAGIGDEVAFAMDLKGQMPPAPGVPEETVENTTIPRFVVARPITDRAKIDAAGKSVAASWRSLTEWANELSGQEYPVILPQKMESGGLETWYPPHPYIRGDFLPGVTLNDKLWMLGTSRAMAEGMAASMATPVTGGENETGMIAEIDFAPLRAWAEEIEKEQGVELGDLAKEATADQSEAIREQSLKSLEGFRRAFDRMQGLSYRKWLAEGAPRTSLHLRMAE